MATVQAASKPTLLLFDRHCLVVAVVMDLSSQVDIRFSGGEFHGLASG